MNPSAAAGEDMTGDDCGPEKIVTEITPVAVPNAVDVETEIAASPALVGVPVIWRVEEL